jgi:hypothetical protein
MKIKTIEYAETKTQPGFNNVKVGFIADVEKGENADDVLKALKEKVGIETSPELRSYSSYLSDMKEEITRITQVKNELQMEYNELRNKVVKYKITEETLKEAKNGF